MIKKMERPNLDNYKDEIHHPNGFIEDIWRHNEYVEDLEKYVNYLETQNELNNNGDLGSIIIPNNKSEKNIILSRAMTYLSEDAEECAMTKQVFDELASLMDK